jgi:hypothetical protein
MRTENTKNTITTIVKKVWMPMKKLHLTTNIGDTKQDATLSLSICKSIVAAQWRINKLLNK